MNSKAKRLYGVLLWNPLETSFRSAKRACDVMTQKRLKQTYRNGERFEISLSASASDPKTLLFETKTSPTFPLFLSEHTYRYVVWPAQQFALYFYTSRPSLLTKLNKILIYYSRIFQVASYLLVKTFYYNLEIDLSLTGKKEFTKIRHVLT